MLKIMLQVIHIRQNEGLPALMFWEPGNFFSNLGQCLSRNIEGNV